MTNEKLSRAKFGSIVDLKAGMSNSSCCAGRKINFISKNVASGPQMIKYKTLYFVVNMFFALFLILISQKILIW